MSSDDDMNCPIYEGVDHVVQEEVRYQIKILLIGDSAVGKTSIMFRYCDKTYTPMFISTIGKLSKLTII
jgi:GTPase SAR1 family protein